MRCCDMSSGGLADTYFLFQLLGVPFTWENVLTYIAICGFIFLVGICGCALLGR